jgi:hypothetical protein
MKKGRGFLLGILIFVSVASVAAQPVGNIRGTVVDAVSRQPLVGAAVVVQGTNPAVGTTADGKGAFSLPPLKSGRYNIEVSYLGYETSIVHEVMVSPAKEAVLEVALVEQALEVGEVVVVARANKAAPLNPMVLTGARMLSVEEANRYAGGLDDPARLVTSFAGAAGDVTNNSISVRGNSPQFLQWKLEDVEIPNPSHYPEIGSVGGGVLTALSSQVLGNSDFFTGAFPAQYGNALSGVFDMMLRNGNNQRYEHTAQLGTLGVEFGSEGPFKKGGQGSYLFNYRYSSMALAADIAGGGMKEVEGMKYQDYSFKVNLPTRKAGIFTLWGIGTNDRFSQPLDDDYRTTLEYNEGDGRTRQYMAAGGLGHRIVLGGETWLKTTLAATHAYNHFWYDLFQPAYPDLGLTRVMDMTDRNTNLIFNSYVNARLGARHTNRTGATVTGIFYDDNYNMAPGGYYPTGPIANFADTDGRSALASVFTQSIYQFDERLTGEAGVNGQYFALNGHWTVEPRLSLRWKAAPRHTVALAAGMHSRHERLDYYFVNIDGKMVNKDLDFAKARHLALSWDWQIADNIHLRVEPYYQYLYDIPVIPGTGRSIINHNTSYMNEPLVNNGKGRNVGLDLTLERYLKNGFYYMLTTSIFDSQYTGDDGVWRNTRYNRGFLANALGGKEWMLGRNRQQILGVNLRMSVMGGSRYTPLDMEASMAAREPIEDECRLFEKQNPTNVILHATLTYKINRPGLTHEFGAMMLNVTGNKEYFGWEYNYKTNTLDPVTTAVGIPNIYYRISF